MWTFPEPTEDIKAQIEALRLGAKRAVFVCGKIDPELIPQHMITVYRDEGTLITRSRALADLFAEKTSLNDDDLALILGYPESKTQLQGFLVVIQALDRSGAVVIEAAASLARLYETAAFVATHIPEGGRLKVTDAISALSRRAEKLGEENARHN